MPPSKINPAALIVCAMLGLAAPDRSAAQCPPDTLLTAHDNPAPAERDNFGRSVAVSGNLVVAGAHRDAPGGGFQTGAAHVFDAATGALVVTLDNPTPSPNDYFGISVAISGDIVVVGASQDAGGGLPAAGTAYIFDIDPARPTFGSLLVTLNNPEPTAGDLFGQSVAVSGGVAVVGAHGDDPGGVSGAGTAYVFDADPASPTFGALLVTLNNPAPAEEDLFGYAVGVSGSVAVAGAYGDDPGGVSASGSAYVFDADPASPAFGALLATLDNPAPGVFDLFGRSVAVAGGIAVVGAPWDSPGGVSMAGAAYVFDVDPASPMFGTLIATLNNPASAASDDFGSSVAASGGYVVVGAPSDDPGGVSDTGAAYVFEAMSGTLLASLDNPAAGVRDYFGISAGISGDFAVVGAWGDDPGGVTGAGSAYLFTCASLTPTPTPTASAPPSAVPSAFPSPTATATPMPGTPTASPTPVCCPGNADNSGGSVNANDFLAVQAAFGMNNGTGGLGDADCSGGAVNANDFLAVQASFGSSCG